MKEFRQLRNTIAISQKYRYCFIFNQGGSTYFFSHIVNEVSSNSNLDNHSNKIVLLTTN